MRRLPAATVPMALLLLCVTVPAPAGKQADERLLLATREVEESQLLDVSIRIFREMDAKDRREAESERKIRRVYPEVRRSEARFLPYHLKTTLEQSAHWGAVRVVPDLPDGYMVGVEGTILDSFGDNLEIHIRVQDATGRLWFQDEFLHTADRIPSLKNLEAAEEVGEPFQGLYNAVANRILRSRRKLSAAEIREIQDVSRLRFAAALAPDAFAGHLTRNRKGLFSPRRLPASDDPMYARVMQAQQRDHMLVDTLNDHYAALYLQMEPSYDEWRHHATEELYAFRKMRSKARKRKALGVLAILGSIVLAEEDVVSDTSATVGVLAGMEVFRTGLQRSQEARIHLEALEEMSQSFESEVEPMVIEVEGEVVRLQGSAEDQYASWRKILKRIFAEETGLQDPDGEPAGSEPGTDPRVDS